MFKAIELVHKLYAFFGTYILVPFTPYQQERIYLLLSGPPPSRLAVTVLLKRCQGNLLTHSSIGTVLCGLNNKILVWGCFFCVWGVFPYHHHSPPPPDFCFQQKTPLLLQCASEIMGSKAFPDLW